jgi:hypothetical protein
VDRFQHRRVVIERQVPEPVKSRDGLVHAGVAGRLRGLQRRPGCLSGRAGWHPGWHPVGSFPIHVLDFALALPPARPHLAAGACFPARALRRSVERGPFC